MPDNDIDEPDYVDDISPQAAKALNIPQALAAEVMFLNDEGACDPETPEQRHVRMREWVSTQIKVPTPDAQP